ncbi:transglycosylase domain-containing protein [Tannockella kyphosi]|uniref:transglycosylase domain-containing protein n=1 Tax=Tannockella kyphosi TaxID=2899121 RepID=UPI0020136F9C|nr:transglycosylase domain-containing protein [Tannockella kyphosi]
MGKIWKKFLSFLKKVKWLRIFIFLFIVGCIAVGGVVGYFAYNVIQETEAFDVEKLYSAEASKIYDEDGEVVYTYGDDVNGDRVNVTYDELPQVLIDAVVSAEDSRFFEHNGFDLPRLLVAAITNIATNFESGGGASTITQQLIKKSYYDGESRTITLKISEMFLAIQATEEISKEETLSLYLNSIYYGRSLSSIGIAAASNYYFNKDVSELTLPEAALLAGTLNSPSSYDPYYNLELATQRRDIILDLMLYHGYITEDECELAKAVSVENMLDNTGSNSSDNALAAYIDLVDQEVRDSTGLDPLETQMNIYTYLDVETQQYAYDIVENDLSFPNDDMQIAASIEDVDNGRIIAVIGGRDYTVFDYNRADTKQQPGSSLKPIIDYGAAYEFLDWSTAHTVEDLEYDKNNYNPSNWDGTSGGTHGQMTISDALYSSWNTCAVWTFDSVVSQIGSSGYYDYLEGFQIDMTGEEVNIAYAIGGWNNGLSPIELTSMYATVSNGGTAYESHTINYIDIVNSDEDIMIDEEVQANATEAISDETAFMIKETMSDYSSTGSYGTYFNFGQICAKTGTSNWGSNNYGISEGSAKDSWVATYNPDYAMAVWCGYDYTTLSDNPQSMNGYTTLARQFANAMWKELTSDGVENSYPSNPGLTYGSIVKGLYPYVAATDDTPSSDVYSGWFKSGTYPSTTYDSLTCGTLETFEASIGTSGIDVTFSAYDPIEATTDESYNSYTSSFGLVVYTVTVQDSETLETLYTESLNQATGTINYTPTSEVLVTGYYSYANSSSITSNTITVTVGEGLFSLEDIFLTVSSGGTALSSDSSIEVGNSISFSVVTQRDDSVITYDLFDSSNTLIESSTHTDYSHTFYTAGTYTIEINESCGTVWAPTKYFTVTINEVSDDSSQDTTH